METHDQNNPQEQYSKSETYRSELFERVKEKSDIFTFMQSEVLDGIWYWDLEDPDKGWISPQFWRVLGYDGDLDGDILPKFEDIAFPEDWARSLQLLEEHIKNPGSRAKLVIRYTTKQGAIAWIHTIFYVMTNENGIPNRIIGANKDITKQVEFERALQDRITRYDHILKGTHIGTWEWNVQTGETIFNERWADIVGFTLAELGETTVDTWIGFCHPEDLKESDKQLQAHFRGETEFYEFEARMKHREGHWVWVKDKGKVVSWTEDGKPLWMTGSHQDVTQEREFVNELQKAYERQKSFVEQAPTPIAMFDRDMNHLAASEKWVEQTGDKQNLIGQSYYDVFPEHVDRWKNIHKNALNGHVEKRDEEAFSTPDGDLYWLQWEVRPWYLTENEIGGVLVYFADITKQKKAELEIKALLGVATNQNQRLLNFAHIVSHNLRSHSSNLSMMLELMEVENVEHTQNAYYPLLKEAVEGLKETLFHLNEVVTINLQSEKGMETIPLQSHVEKCIINLKATILESKGCIQNLVSTNCKIQGVPAYVDSILLNLLSNAMKYKKPDVPPEIKLSCEMSGGYVKLSIEDNGQGIDLRRHGRKLFGLFKTFHANEDARGVGLFITKNQVEALGGRIEVESQLGKGTVFHIFFQAAT